MPTNKQRREAERRRLQRQLEQRRQRELARRRFTLIASVVGTLAVIVIVVVIVIATTGGDDTKSKKQAAGPKTSSAPATTSAPASSTAPLPTTACAGPTKAATASFKGVTVGSAIDLKHEPKVRSKSATAPAALECQDLVVGTGKAAGPGAKVSVQYTGVLYASGKQFDSSWAKAGAKPASFTLDPTSVIPGFNQGIGGAGKVAPMKIGGRRIIIMPASLAYGANGNGAVPANAALVFVVDLKTVAG